MCCVAGVVQLDVWYTCSLRAWALTVYSLHCMCPMSLYTQVLNALDFAGTEGPWQRLGPQQAEGPSKDHSLQHPSGQPKGWTAEEVWDWRSGLKWHHLPVSGRRKSIILQHQALWYEMQSRVLPKSVAAPSDSQGVSASKHRGGGGEFVAEPLHCHHHWGQPWPPSCGEEVICWWKPPGASIHSSFDCRLEGSCILLHFCIWKMKCEMCFSFIIGGCSKTEKNSPAWQNFWSAMHCRGHCQD